MKVRWDRTYGFSPFSEKTSKSNHLQMSLQRQHFLLSYLKTLSVGPAWVWTCDPPRSADQCSPDWASHAKVSTTVEWRVCSTFCYMYSMSCTVWTILEHIANKIHLAGRVWASEPVLKIPGVSLYTPHPKKNHVEAIMRQVGVMTADYTCD